MRKLILIIAVLFTTATICNAQKSKSSDKKTSTAVAEADKKIAEMRKEITDAEDAKVAAEAKAAAAEAKVAAAEEKAKVAEQAKTDLLAYGNKTVQQIDSLNAQLLKAKTVSKGNIYRPVKGKLLLNYKDSTAYYVKSDSAQFVDQIPQGFKHKAGAR